MASTASRIVSAFSRLAVVAVIAIAFTLGLVATVYLSLRSPKIQVPDIVNKPYIEGESTLEKAGLSMRERARRYKPDVAPGVILDQSPRAGEVVKAGQTVAVVISRARKEGEQPPSEEVAAERKREETGETRNANDASKNENRERKNRSKNSNANSNANVNANINGNTGAQNSANSNRILSNASARNTNLGLNANRGANANRNANDGARQPRNPSTGNVNAGGVRTARPTRPVANTNRRPNP